VEGAPEAMRYLAAAAVLAASAARAQLISQSTIAPVGGANALSTPAARHLARMDSGTYLLALQRDGALPDPGLSLYRSDDDGRSWRLYAPLNPNALERHTADILRVGGDLAVVTSFDAPSIQPDARLDPPRKVSFQWWRTDGAPPAPRIRQPQFRIPSNADRKNRARTIQCGTVAPQFRRLPFHRIYDQLHFRTYRCAGAGSLGEGSHYVPDFYFVEHCCSAYLAGCRHPVIFARAQLFARRTTAQITPHESSCAALSAYENQNAGR